MAVVGATTITEKTSGSVKKIKFAWTSDASGNASGVLTAGHYDGKIITLVTDPGAQSPTDNYDIAIVDDDGLDVLVGAGLNRSTATTQLVAEASLGAVALSKLELQVSNAGGFKQGDVYLYIR